MYEEVDDSGRGERQLGINFTFTKNIRSFQVAAGFQSWVSNIYKYFLYRFMKKYLLLLNL